MVLRPLYTIRDLQVMTGLSRYQVMHLLKESGIKLIRVGRRLYVPTASLYAKAANVAESIALTERLLAEATRVELSEVPEEVEPDI